MNCSSHSLGNSAGQRAGTTGLLRPIGVFGGVGLTSGCSRTLKVSSWRRSEHGRIYALTETLMTYVAPRVQIGRWATAPRTSKQIVGGRVFL